MAPASGGRKPPSATRLLDGGDGDVALLHGPDVGGVGGVGVEDVADLVDGLPQLGRVARPGDVEQHVLEPRDGL